MRTRDARGLAAGGLVAGLAAALALCPSASAQIYWANQGGTTIGRASLDGLTIDPSFVIGATAPTGVAIDGGHVYWAHGAGSGSIGRAELDGTTDKTQTFIAASSPPGGVTLDSSGLYWTHVVTGVGKVGRANVNGSSLNPSFVSTGTTSPCGVAIDFDNLYWANPGNPGTIGSSHGMFSVTQSFIPMQADPCGVAVTSSYVYWTNRAGETIGRANVDGSSPNASFIDTGMGSGPCGVAVDDAHVYWSNQSDDTIGRADLDGSNPDPDFIDTGAGSSPCGVAVSPTLAVAPTTFTFSDTEVGTQSDIQAFLVANTSSSVHDVSGASFVGANAGDFEKTGDSCTPNVTPAGAGCVINVRFSPTAEGARSAALRVTSNASNSPIDIPLTGVATAPAPAPDVSDTEPPDTTIAAGPPSKTKKKKASFEFSSTEPGSAFECRLDNGPFEPCVSPKDYRVGKGKHSFEARATDAAGNADPTPATRSWTVKKRKPKK